MKRVMILAMIAVIACAALYAADLQMGVALNASNTSFLFDAEFEHAGVETSVGLPVLSGAVAAINACVNENESSEDGSSGFAAPLGVMANVYLKPIRGERLSMRLGLQADVLGIFGPDYVWVTGYSGLSLGLNFKFNDRFSMNLTGCVPLVIMLNPVSEDVAGYTMVFYASGSGNAMSDALMDVYGGLATIASHVARVSCKWSI